MATDNLKRGALLMIAAGLLFAGVGVSVRVLSQSLPNEMVVFFRSTMGLIVLLPLVWRRGWKNLGTRHWRGHLARGLAGVIAMYCYFYAIAHLPLAVATLLNYSTPLFVPFIALLWLGEGVSARLWTAILTGFVGILLILKPGMELFAPAALIGLASGVFAAFAAVGIRRLTHTEPAWRIVFYFSLTCTAVSAIPLVWSWQTPPPELWLLLAAVGALASLAQLLFTRAYAYGPAAQVGPFGYSTVVFAAIAGGVLWGEVLDLLSLTGAVLVCLGGILVIRIASTSTSVPELPARME